MPATLQQSVLELIDPPTGFKPWHGGPTLAGTLRGIKIKEAGWKPAPERHSIHELSLHIAYWDYAVRRYLKSLPQNGFPHSPANWPTPKTSPESDWEDDKKLCLNEHRKLVKALEEFPYRRYKEPISSHKNWTFAQLIIGAAAHKTYHIGQIQLMKRLYKDLVKQSKA